MSIDRYVTMLRARLPLSPSRAAEVSEEVRGHLEDAARDLQMAGLAPDASEHEAIRRFGAAEEIAAAMARANRRRRPATRGVLSALVVATALVALGGSAVSAAYTPPASSGSPHTTRVGGHTAPLPSAITIRGGH
jgi:hypothetical protein